MPLKVAAAPILEASPLVIEPTNPKVGVLLLNLGGPETGDDVEGAFAVSPSPVERREMTDYPLLLSSS
jgi:hypothetical protein